MTDINLKGGKLSIEQLNTIFETIPSYFWNMLRNFGVGII